MAQNYPNYPANHQLAEPRKSSALKWVMITLLCVLLVSGGIFAMVITAIRSNPPIAAHAPIPAEPAEPGIPPPPPAPPAPPEGKATLDLGKYKYPGATIDKQVRVFGNEILNMRTNDSYEEVKKFYQPLFGEPMVESNDDNEPKLVYQAAGNGSVLVTIQNDESHPGQVQIVVVRSPFQIPK
jgi:hypothetical protein